MAGYCVYYSHGRYVRLHREKNDRETWGSQSNQVIMIYRQKEPSIFREPETLSISCSQQVPTLVWGYLIGFVFEWHSIFILKFVENKRCSLQSCVASDLLWILKYAEIGMRMPQCALNNAGLQLEEWILSWRTIDRCCLWMSKNTSELMSDMLHGIHFPSVCEGREKRMACILLSFQNNPLV